MQVKANVTVILTASDVEAAVHALSALINLCSRSSNIDPLIREGGPISAGQRYMRETGVLDTVIELLQSPFASGAYDIEQLRALASTTYSPLFQLLRHAYRLLKQSAKQNNDNKLYLMQYIPVLQSQVFDRVERSSLDAMQRGV